MSPDNVTESFQVGEDILSPAAYLVQQSMAVIEHAIQQRRSGLFFLESLRNLDGVIGTQYGDRVLYELLQNAHDAHSSEGAGEIHIRLELRGKDDGTLYVANKGSGLSEDSVRAISNLALSSKRVGEGIGNKGLGFRSITSLTSNVHIYSQRTAEPAESFSGFCFRFATQAEREDMLGAQGCPEDQVQDLAETIPQFLVPVPLNDQPSEVCEFSRQGFATVIVAPLETELAVSVARGQVEKLLGRKAPLLLFLERLKQVRFEILTPESEPEVKTLQRSSRQIGKLTADSSSTLRMVDLGDGQKFLTVRCVANKERVRDAVRRSLGQAPHLSDWLEWQGDAVVSVAIAADGGGGINGCLYNFLPMSDDATAPLPGHLDAPFYSNIDRRNVDLSLPLNAQLIRITAEACLAAARWITNNEGVVSQIAAFDFIAWIGEQAKHLDAALISNGTAFATAPLIPTINKAGGVSWNSLAQVRIWPEVNQELLTAQGMARRTSSILVSPLLDHQRLKRLAEMANRVSHDLGPKQSELGKWAEEFAHSLVKQRFLPANWIRFYTELMSVCRERKVKMAGFAQSKILLCNDGELQSENSGPRDRGKVYVLADGPSSRKRDAALQPPDKLFNRYRLFHAKVRLPRVTLDAYIDAELLKEFDPLEALAELKSALGPRAGVERLRDALLWAFRVWRAKQDEARDALLQAGLYVLTVSGWKPAALSAFSDTWTPLGKTLEFYLVDAARISRDCQQNRDLLLVGYTKWPAAKNDTKSDWIRFLKLLGVMDGLRPVPCALEEKDYGGTWNAFLDNGNDAIGFDKAWRSDASVYRFGHRDSYYTIKYGELPCRFPGQLEYSQFPEITREKLFHLLFAHLRTQRGRYFHFRVGRYEKNQTKQDEQTLPTPLASFFRAHAWIPVGEDDGAIYTTVSNCWAKRTAGLRDRLPRFIETLPYEQAKELHDDSTLADFLFSRDIGLRDWDNSETGLARLEILARKASSIEPRDRPLFLREYEEAWQDTAKHHSAIPQSLDIAVQRRGQIERLSPGEHHPNTVFVTHDAQGAEARLLSSEGHALLEVDKEQSLETVVQLLKTSWGFAPRLFNDGGSVRLMLDGEPFAPSPSDPLFLEQLGLEWLTEMLVIGLDRFGEQLERRIPPAFLESRSRSLRLRLCESITFVIDGQATSGNTSSFHTYEHKELPTLILSRSFVLNLDRLALDLAGPLSTLLDSRVRFMKPMLQRLAICCRGGGLEAPSVEALANIFDCDIQRIQEYRQEQQSSLERILHLLRLVVAYYGDTHMAIRLMDDAGAGGQGFQPGPWLAEHLSTCPYSPETLLDACGRARTPSQLLSLLGLDFVTFNKALLGLGEAPVSHEEELYHAYDAYLIELRPGILDRLRRFHLGDFQSGQSLALYVERKSLAFLPFNMEWVSTRETLTQDEVHDHVRRLLDSTLDDAKITITLPSLVNVLEPNRRALAHFVKEARLCVLAWCKKNGQPLPEGWDQDCDSAVIRLVEDQGLLDFLPLDAPALPDFCQRAGCWPQGMPLVLDRSELGLIEGELDEERQRQEMMRQQAEKAKREIRFAGAVLDTEDASFSSNLQEITDQWLDRDEWFLRSSQKVDLKSLAAQCSQAGTGGIGKRKGHGVVSRHLSEAQRTAMGRTSELLAFRYLQRRFPDVTDERCWVSTNRSLFFGGGDGDDAAGYDFMVKTRGADYLFEVKSSQDFSGEFEMSANEIRVAAIAAKSRRQKYRILYVPHVFDPGKWFVLELPNPMDDKERVLFQEVGRGGLRLRFECE